MQRLTTFMLLTLCLASTIVLADDTPDGKKSLGGSGQMIQFDLSESGRTIAGIQIHGSRYGSATPPDESFLIYVLTEDLTKIAGARMAPYSLFERGPEKWVTVRFDDPVDVPNKGWIVVDFRAGRTKGVYVSFDTDSDGSSSMTGLPGTKTSKPDFDGDWMIRPFAEN